MILFDTWVVVGRGAGSPAILLCTTSCPIVASLTLHENDLTTYEKLNYALVSKEAYDLILTSVTTITFPQAIYAMTEIMFKYKIKYNAM
jgi:hypothetical protein